MWRSKCYFRRAKTAGRECRSNHSIRSVWKLPSAETITCVVPTFSCHAESTCFTERMRFGAMPVPAGRAQFLFDKTSTFFQERHRHAHTPGPLKQLEIKALGSGMSSFAIRKDASEVTPLVKQLKEGKPSRKKSSDTPTVGRRIPHKVHLEHLFQGAPNYHLLIIC